MGYLKYELTDDFIIDKIGGEEAQQRSCASLSLAYIANKKGYNVVDMRGDKSADFFSDDTIWEMLCKKNNGYYTKGVNELTEGIKLIGSLGEGKNYVLGIGEHTAIVRNNAGAIEYLELQEKNNGFVALDEKALKKRFNVAKKNTSRGVYLLDIDNIDIDGYFVDMLGYIDNTPQKHRKKKR